jgi:putative AlgH/UPF0301 family transcriptional regulator
MKVLLSTPKIKDSYFHKLMILLNKVDKNYFYGLILNRTMDERVSELWESINPDASIHRDNKLRIGGPLYGKVCVIHKIQKYSEEELFPKTYLSVKPYNIEKIIANKTKPYEMYIGYCCWTPTQLATEVMNGDWWETDAEDLMIFGDNFDYWTLKKEEQNKKMLDKLNIKIQNHYLN